jgi:putative ABC transport system substrate-binding protein
MFTRLGELGWSTGLFGTGNLKVEYQTADPGKTDVAPMADALARANCDLIIAPNSMLALAARAAATSTPLVFLYAGDPVAAGLVRSMAQPGGNATGLIVVPDSAAKLLSLLKEVAPRARRVTVLYGEAYRPVAEPRYALLSTAAAAAGIALQAQPIRTREDVHALDAKWAGAPVDGLIVFFDTVTYEHKGDIVRLAALNRVPAVYASRYYVEAGGLLSYGIDWPAAVLRTAEIAAKVLDGTKPADIPVERVSQFELLVNQRAARALGITVPQSVLAQATEVIQ